METNLSKNPEFDKAFTVFVDRWAPKGQDESKFIVDLLLVVEAGIKKDPYDAVTRRRLTDGKVAMALLEIDPRSPSERDQQLETLYQGIAALQSLDSLGSDEENMKAWSDMKAIQNRYDALMRRKE